MRLTVTLDDARGSLIVRVERALDYPPERVPGPLAAAVPGPLAAAVAEALTHHVPDGVMVPAPRPVAGESPPESSGTDEARVRQGVLRALDDGSTVEDAAFRFGIDPELIHRWDDDAAVDAYTDLLAGPDRCPRPQRAS